MEEARAALKMLRLCGAGVPPYLWAEEIGSHGGPLRHARTGS